MTMVVEKVHRVIKFDQEEYFKSYIDKGTELKNKNFKNDFGEFFFRLRINFVFGKTMENMRIHRDIKLLTIGKKRN